MVQSTKQSGKTENWSLNVSLSHIVLDVFVIINVEHVIKIFYCRQIALADVIILNKEDLVSSVELIELKNHIQYVNFYIRFSFWNAKLLPTDF